MRRKNWTAMAILGLAVALAAQGKETREKIDEDLKAGRYAEALVKVQKELVELPKEIFDQKRSADDLGIAVVQLALAEAGTGDRDAAFWHGQLARRLFPVAARFDLAPFGELGQALKLPPPLPAGEAPIEINERNWVGGMTVPAKKSGKDPAFPRNAFRGQHLSAALRVLVGADGKATRPKFLDVQGDPTMLFLGLESVRNWTFTPATRDGQAFPAYWSFLATFSANLNLAPVVVSPIALPTTPPPG